MAHFTFTYNIDSMVQIRKETANIWEYKVSNNANIANFEWKTR